MALVGREVAFLRDLLNDGVVLDVVEVVVGLADLEDVIVTHPVRLMHLEIEHQSFHVLLPDQIFIVAQNLPAVIIPIQVFQLGPDPR